jgi:hypothetical protein
VLNTTALANASDASVFISESISPFFIVQNGATGAGAQSVTTTSTLGTLLISPSGPPVVTIVSPANGSTVFEGQTIDIAVYAGGSALVSSELTVNGVVLALDRSLPYNFTFTVPAGVTGLTLLASVANDQGAVGVSQPLAVSVLPDPRTTVIGRLVDANNLPIGNREVAVTLNGLRAEFFDFVTPLTSVPELTGLVPTRTGHVSAVNLRNPNSVFGSDPFGAGMIPDYAGRLSGYLWIETAGDYTFAVGAVEGARLVINGATAIQTPAGRTSFGIDAQTVALPAGWIPIEVAYYQAVGDTELQLLYGAPGDELRVVAPDALRVAMPQFTVRTDGDGRFVVANVPANVSAVRVSGESGDLSNPVPPAPGGVTDFGDVVNR